MLKESDIVHMLQASFPSTHGATGIGDDAAVLPLSTTESYVISKDILAEHRHFRLTTTDAASLAHKALHVNLSDIAAMGATPCFVLLGIALPASLGQEWVSDFLAAFTVSCKQAKVVLIGGDTTAAEHDLFISITVIGKVETAHLKFRRNARIGQALCVAGPLGEAAAGLAALQKNAAGHDAVKARSLRPQALTREGIWLGTQTGLSAMMDISDGLYVDVGRMMQGSQSGAAIDVAHLQASTDLQEACAALSLDPLDCMLTGGEDYALLLAIEADAVAGITAEFEKKFGYKLMRIGSVASSSGVTLREGGKTIPFTYRPFSHFGEL